MKLTGFESNKINSEMVNHPSHYNLPNRKECMKAVEEQPTAFDVENVVSNLEQLKLDGACEDCGYCECLNECWDGDMSEEHAIDMAIEIVKRGGLDES